MVNLVQKMFVNLSILMGLSKIIVLIFFCSYSYGQANFPLYVTLDSLAKPPTLKIYDSLEYVYQTKRCLEIEINFDTVKPTLLKFDFPVSGYVKYSDKMENFNYSLILIKKIHEDQYLIVVDLSNEYFGEKYYFLQGYFLKIKDNTYEFVNDSENIVLSGNDKLLFRFEKKMIEVYYNTKISNDSWNSGCNKYPAPQ